MSVLLSQNFKSTSTTRPQWTCKYSHSYSCLGVGLCSPHFSWQRWYFKLSVKANIMCMDPIFVCIYTDLADQGSNHIAETVVELKRQWELRILYWTQFRVLCFSFIKNRKPSLLVECLTPDFRGDTVCVDTIVHSGLDVFAHNIETVEELTWLVRDPRAKYQ